MPDRRWALCGAGRIGQALTTLGWIRKAVYRSQNVVSRHIRVAWRVPTRRSMAPCAERQCARHAVWPACRLPSNLFGLQLAGIRLGIIDQLAHVSGRRLFHHHRIIWTIAIPGAASTHGSGNRLPWRQAARLAFSGDGLHDQRRKHLDCATRGMPRTETSTLFSLAFGDKQ
jgi:hypothetical protein